MENKLYTQCKEEITVLAIEKEIEEKDIDQLTSELYAMKLLEWSSKSNLTIIHGAWCLNNKEIFSLTQQLHDHFVEQFNKEGK